MEEINLNTIMQLVFCSLKSAFTFFISLTLSGGCCYSQFTSELTEDWGGNMLATAKTQPKMLRLSSIPTLSDILYPLKRFAFTKSLISTFLFNSECLARSNYSLNVTYVIILSFRVRLLDGNGNF